jgi:5-methylcytosine-specific restriction protein A
MECDLCYRRFDGRESQWTEERHRTKDGRTGKWILVQLRLRTPHKRRFCSERCLNLWRTGWISSTCHNCGDPFRGRVCRNRAAWRRNLIFCTQGCRVVFPLRKVRTEAGKNPYRRGDGWRRVRWTALMRDGSFCQVCGKRLEKTKLVVDHIVPFRLSQQHDARNLLPICVPCQKRKTEIESRLFRGDVGGFLCDLRKARWPSKRVRAAMKLYGLPLHLRPRPLPLFWVTARS